MKTCVLTGATGSVGLGIATRFLEEHDDIQLILTCRNLQKGRETLLQLQRNRKPNQQIKILTMDLSDPRGVVKSMNKLRQMVEKIDFLVLNAGLMVTEGIDLIKGTKNLLTRPSWVAKTGGDIMTQTKGKLTVDDLGYVFCCNLFGHYIMVKECLDLLELSDIGARVIWSSSTTAQPEFFDFDDYQCKKGANPYESSKRLTELISYTLSEELSKRNIFMFATSPGNVLSNISTSQASTVLVAFALCLMRVCLISGINITGYNAATSTMFLALEEDPSRLDPIKLYHSEIGVFGNRSVKILDVEFTKEDLSKTKKVITEMDRLITNFK